ncbi:MAG TPA: hypothetical protein VLS45_05600, partial [Methylomicrobium sp.]|nr:hypothetical protein [Methylomicrobium sp.]
VQRRSCKYFRFRRRLAEFCTKRDVHSIRRRYPDNADAIRVATNIWTKRRREYRELLREKRQLFWQAKVTAQRLSPRQLWNSVDTLMGRGHNPASADITADMAHRFFDSKVDGVRAATNNASPPSYTPAPPGCILRDFQRLKIDDVTAAVRLLPDKQCMSDPLPTRLLKDHIDILVPFLTELFNKSMLSSLVPSVFKAAFVSPLLKKPGLDPADAKSYRPISNLSVLSKLLERLVARQLIDYLTTAGLLPELQSSVTPLNRDSSVEGSGGHSTSSRQRRPLSSDIAGLIRRLRHCGP